MNENTIRTISTLDDMLNHFGSYEAAREAISDVTKRKGCRMQETGDVGELIKSWAKAHAIRINDKWMLKIATNATKLSEALKAQGKGVKFQHFTTLSAALDKHEALAKERAERQSAKEACRADYAKLRTARFGERTVWIPMDEIAAMQMSDWTPVLGDKPVTQLQAADKSREAFELAYGEALKAAELDPKNYEAFAEWHRGFCASYRKKNGGVPHVAGMRLLTRNFGKRHGTMGCFVLKAEVALFKSVAKEQLEASEAHREENFKKHPANSGKKFFKRSLRLGDSDPYVGVLKHRMFFQPLDAHIRQEERQAVEDRNRTERQTIAEGLGINPGDVNAFLEKISAKGKPQSKRRPSKKELRAQRVGKKAGYQVDQQG